MCQTLCQAGDNIEKSNEMIKSGEDKSVRLKKSVILKLFHLMMFMHSLSDIEPLWPSTLFQNIWIKMEKQSQSCGFYAEDSNNPDVSKYSCVHCYPHNHFWRIEIFIFSEMALLWVHSVLSVSRYKPTNILSLIRAKCNLCFQSKSNPTHPLYSPQKEE